MNTKIIAGALGFVTLISVVLIRKLTILRLPDPIVREAKEFSVDPYELNDINEIEKRLFKKNPISRSEWDRYKHYALGGNLVFKRKIARHLSAAKGSVYASEALVIAVDFSQSADATVRANSLIALKAFEHPGWKELAQKHLTDTDEQPRRVAKLLLNQ